MFKHKKKLILSILITLLPILIGIALWSRLPDRLPIHWDVNNHPDGFAPKAIAVFVLPLVLTAIHLLCLWLTFADPKNKNSAGKVLLVVFWICPVISLLVSGAVFAFALGFSFPDASLVALLIGIMFIILGICMPKIHHNYTFGIRLPWTVHSEKNWNATHRFAAPFWIVGGILMIPAALLNWTFLIIGVLLCVAVAPTLYSFIYYIRNEK